MDTRAEGSCPQKDIAFVFHQSYGIPTHQMRHAFRHDRSMEMTSRHKSKCLYLVVSGILSILLCFGCSLDFGGSGTSGSGEKSKVFQITLKDADDADYYILHVRSGAKIRRPLVPDKPGYALSGWYIDGGRTIPFTFSSAINSDMVLYSDWIIDEEEGTTATIDLSSSAPIAGSYIPTGTAAITAYYDGEKLTLSNTSEKVAAVVFKGNYDGTEDTVIENLSIQFRWNFTSDFTIEFEDFGFRAPAGMVALDLSQLQADRDVRLVCNGDCLISSADGFAGNSETSAAIICNCGISIDGSGDCQIRGGNGSSGNSTRATGYNGQKAIIAESLLITYEGYLAICGGDGGTGTDGGTGASGVNGVNAVAVPFVVAGTAGSSGSAGTSGAPGGDGALAIEATTLALSSRGIVKIDGGRGGNGGTGGTGGKGGNGGNADVVLYTGYTGGNGGNGGAGGDTGKNASAISVSSAFMAIPNKYIILTSGDNGVGGTGGTGGAAGRGGNSNAWGGNGGRGGNGGKGGQGGNAYASIPNAYTGELFEAKKEMLSTIEVRKGDNGTPGSGGTGGKAGAMGVNNGGMLQGSNGTPGVQGSLGDSGSLLSTW